LWRQPSQAGEAPQVLVRAGKSGSGSRAVTQQSESRKRAPQPSPQPRGEQSHGRGAQSRVIRVIGGAMRGRRWRFPDIPDVRPTPDRVRETLFNWLGPRIVGARCLDLFAGSGALGLESLSRGASSVVFVEQHAAIARALSALMTEWNVQGALVSPTDAFSYLRGTPRPFDIVFLDPPFAAGLLAPAATLLEEKGWLAPDALIYMESAARETRPDLPRAWVERKAKQAGLVGYHLFARNPGAAVPE
jgi:16S rRNA (guanine966-N2)-methyltransferase